MLNKKLLYITTVGLMSSVFSINTKAQTFYQCVPAIEEEDWNKTPILSTPAGTCVFINVKPGLYLVYLRGGKGGDQVVKDYNTGNETNRYYGKEGGYVEYKFKVDKDIPIQLCAGGKGGDGGKYVNRKTYGSTYGDSGCVGGGGAGSWIMIEDKIIAAGGGAGGGVGAFDSYGDIGSGGSYGTGFGCIINHGTTYSSGALNVLGGSVGEFKQYLGSSNYKSVESPQKLLYPGSIRSFFGGYGSVAAAASHQSNVSLKLGCQDPNTGCAELYAWRAN